jgi:molybdopterin-guanine dinucleotide biosynthesis protein A
VGTLGARLSGAPAGAILGGGRATRLGGVAKGLLEVGGRRMIDRVADALAPVTSELLLVTGDPDAAGWLPGARVVRDVLPGGGSAAGIHAALVAAGGPVIVTAWDLPFVDARVIAELLRESDGPTVDAVVPAGATDGTFEPLCGWYAPACADAIAHAWETGDRSLHGVLRRVRTRVVPADCFVAWGGSNRLFFNVNTADDLSRARGIADATDG